jgi:hypothetical protein
MNLSDQNDHKKYIAEKNSNNFSKGNDYYRSMHGFLILQQLIISK